MDIKDLGLSEVELRELVVNRLCDRLLGGDPEGADGLVSEVERRVPELIRSSIDARVKAIGDEVVLPMVTSAIEGIVLQATTAWGEKVGKAATFREFLVARAEAYMIDKVDFEGQSEAERKAHGSYNDRTVGPQTRITFLIEKHLHYHIDAAVKTALQDLNTKLGGALAETVKLKLSEAVASLKVTTVVGR